MASRVPGSIYRNKNRFWWKVKFPGQSRCTFLPLRPEGARWATADRRVAEEVARAIWNRRVLREPPAAASGRPRTITDLAQHYLAYARDYYRDGDEPTGEADNAAAALAYLVALRGTATPEDLSPADLKAVRQAMIGEGLARTTINGYTARIRRAWRWAAGGCGPCSR